MHIVLVNCLRGIGLPRNNVVRFTDRPNMAIVKIAVYYGHIETKQQQQWHLA